MQDILIERYFDNGGNMKAINTIWDIDDENVVLPTEIDIPSEMADEDEISDYLSDTVGFCHKGFELTN